MNTLFIHPFDPTTTFLDEVYNDHLNRSDVTLITGTPISSRLLKNALITNDRIIFLGHGTEYGLWDMLSKRYVITSEHLQFFRNKPIVCFWCNANIFAEKYDLNAFATGMFVSEIREAIKYSLPSDQTLIDESNTLFCSILNRCVFDNVEHIRQEIQNNYIGNNPIIMFNRECMGFGPNKYDSKSDL